MIYPRLLLARNLLSDDGVIFISIDDNEQENLKKICDEVFGAENLLANIIWKRKRGRDNSAKFFSRSHEYLICYSKNIKLLHINYLNLDDETKKAYKNIDNDPRGPWRMLGCWARGTQGGVKYDFMTKNGEYFTERLWLFSKDNLKKLDNENKLIIKGNNIYRKMFIFENKGKIPETLWDNLSNAANAADENKNIFGKIVFDTPKPLPYVEEMLKITSDQNSLILDFFSGSATTAHAVMQLNAEDGGKRKFIMVQLPEACAPDSEAAKAGYENICEIGKERIRRAGEKIRKDNAGKPGIENLDTGFRVLKCDSSNMKDVYYAPSEMDQGLLQDTISNIREDRTDLDLLFGCLVEWGLPLSLPHKTEDICGYAVHFYDYGQNTDDHAALAACFDANISEEAIREIARRQPLRAVFRDASFADSQNRINAAELFRNYAPDTDVRVL